MSGGHFGYEELNFAEKFANQWQDEELNELFDDLFIKGLYRNSGLIKALDLYLSDDITKEDYQKEVDEFKKKWGEKFNKDFYIKKLEAELEQYKQQAMLATAQSLNLHHLITFSPHWPCV